MDMDMYKVIHQAYNTTAAPNKMNMIVREKVQKMKEDPFL